MLCLPVMNNTTHIHLSLRQGSDSVLEIFTVLSEEEVRKKMSKKLKKAKKKAAK